jgi:hypothetical protein
VQEIVRQLEVNQPPPRRRRQQRQPKGSLAPGLQQQAAGETAEGQQLAAMEEDQAPTDGEQQQQ